MISKQLHFLLSKLENEVSQTLLSTSKIETKTVGALRVAGGWVRDKLMGRQSDDIDIALECLSGVEFATIVNAYLERNGGETNKVAVIKANPDQSKHLETANI